MAEYRRWQVENTQKALKNRRVALILALFVWGVQPLLAQVQESHFQVTQNTTGGVTITGYTGPSRIALVIPGTLYGVRVTEIGDSAFTVRGGYSKFTSVVIPDSVTRIGDRAFSACEINRVTLGKGLRFIGESAFGGNNLTEIVIPYSVTEIGRTAFRQNKLTSITLPESVRHVGRNAFGWNPITTLDIPDSLRGAGALEFGSEWTILVGAFGTIYDVEALFTTVLLPANMDIATMRGNFPEALVNFYISQNRASGIYTKNGPIWTRQPHPEAG